MLIFTVSNQIQGQRRMTFITGWRWWGEGKEGTMWTWW